MRPRCELASWLWALAEAPPLMTSSDVHIRPEGVARQACPRMDVRVLRRPPRPGGLLLVRPRSRPCWQCCHAECQALLLSECPVETGRTKRPAGESARLRSNHKAPAVAWQEQRLGGAEGCTAAKLLAKAAWFSAGWADSPQWHLRGGRRSILDEDGGEAKTGRRAAPHPRPRPRFSWLEKSPHG